MRGLGVVEARIVGECRQQALHQRLGIGREFAGDIAGLFQRNQQIMGGGRRIQADPVADAPVGAGIVGQDQRNTLVGVGCGLQARPGQRQVGHGRRPLGHQRVADHINLAGRAAPDLGLEAYGTRDDTPVQLRQDDIHGQVARAQPGILRLPGGFGGAGQDQLEHRDILLEHGAPGARVGGGGRVGSRAQGKAGGIEHHAGPAGLDEPVDRADTGLFLERGHGHRQRIEAALGERGKQVVEDRHVAVLEMAAIQHDECDRAVRADRPPLAPVGQVSVGALGVIDHRARDRGWRLPVHVTAQTAIGDESQ